MLKCAHCGEILPDGARFCGRCGHFLSAEQDRTLLTSHPGPQVGKSVTWQGRESTVVADYSRGSGVFLVQRQRRTRLLWGLLIGGIVVVMVGALAAGGLWLLVLSQPVIKVTSSYHVGTTPAGAAGTDFAVSGQHFTVNSTIHFLLDGKSLPSATAHSDGEGTISTTLNVTSAWPPGRHTLTASDADGHLTPQGVLVEIVPPGEAHTPGPNGAPPDDASFKMLVSLRGYNSSGQAQSGSLTLVVTGHPDPAGGTVCGINGNDFPDDGRPHQVNLSVLLGLEGGQGTIISICRGSYKGGQLDYTRVVTYERLTAYVFLSSATCTYPVPYDQLILHGAFNDARHAGGTFTIPAVTASCSNGQTLAEKAVQGTWTGQLE